MFETIMGYNALFHSFNPVLCLDLWYIFSVEEEEFSWVRFSHRKLLASRAFIAAGHEKIIFISGTKFLGD